ncbi:putative toxin-antitoxin system toxin component, PIN family [Leptolyngbya sp. FACHB-711]|uniref:putative toxin-antitoxin system toxin component, PIN family n=1 Tax=Leptolyngbya sp. FACHB-711 TaxID=2692813 RepID=UPI0016868401|nr:putative toxin-antitoxin system toxin component, PIN family [Leptolyngbya sp. FACHB-711]MBD1852311.1 putative toxin-antitoxin system toxin component, PIN family [Cyanobacteria bacterium FACHB-502]MBD2024502.1 putative toxin-antitoxin system toxin component, PIN family [Leptolyngbya sp. FACHB-711]
MKVVLDTNIWVSGLLWGGSPRQVIIRAEQQQITIAASDRLLSELEATLNYPKLQPRLLRIGIPVEELMLRVRQLVELCSPASLPEVSSLRDPDDLIVIAAAVAANAEVIITGDADLLVLHP